MLDKKLFLTAKRISNRFVQIAITHALYVHFVGKLYCASMVLWLACGFISYRLFISQLLSLAFWIARIPFCTM